MASVSSASLPETAQMNAIPLFSIYERQEQSRFRAFAGSYTLQVILLLLLLLISIATPKVVHVMTHGSVELIAPIDLKHETVTKLTPAPTPAPRLTAPPKMPEIEMPKLVEPTIARVPEPTPNVVRPIPTPPTPVKTAFDDMKAPVAPAPTKVAVTTNVFGSSASATLSDRPANKVQTGGFGDPNGVAINKNGNGSGRGPQLAAVGSFELPSGPGYGNGTGGKSGARGTIASTGFGNGVAAPAPQRVSRGRVEQSQFNIVAEEKRPSTVQQQSVTIPVSVVSKPTPIYTEEARRLHVEGEVLVKVVFTANGQVRVIGVAKGLGHGLDEAAITAAQQIKFKPATRDGAAVDSTATLHIVFALS